jgi:hypothetical protein
MSDPQRELRRVFAFLGLPPCESIDAIPVNTAAQRGRQVKPMEEVGGCCLVLLLPPPLLLLRWRWRCWLVDSVWCCCCWCWVVVVWLTGRVHLCMRQRRGRRSGAAQSPSRPASLSAWSGPQATRRRLEAFFAPHNQALYEFTGENYGW